MQMAGEVRGRLATQLLERLRLKQAAERMLETADLKWGARRPDSPFRGPVPGGHSLAGHWWRPHNRCRYSRCWAPCWRGPLPLLYARRKAQGTGAASSKSSFPDCLEFISRSMRAGHAFSVSLEMVHRSSANRWPENSGAPSRNRTWGSRWRSCCKSWRTGCRPGRAVLRLGGAAAEAHRRQSGGTARQAGGHHPASVSNCARASAPSAPRV